MGELEKMRIVRAQPIREMRFDGGCVQTRCRCERDAYSERRERESRWLGAQQDAQRSTPTLGRTSEPAGDERLSSEDRAERDNAPAQPLKSGQLVCCHREGRSL